MKNLLFRAFRIHKGSRSLFCFDADQRQFALTCFFISMRKSHVFPSGSRCLWALDSNDNEYVNVYYLYRAISVYLCPTALNE